MVLEAEKSKIKVPACSVPGESSLPGLQMEYPHTMEWETEIFLSSSYKATVLSD